MKLKIGKTYYYKYHKSYDENRYIIYKVISASRYQKIVTYYCKVIIDIGSNWNTMTIDSGSHMEKWSEELTDELKAELL